MLVLFDRAGYAAGNLGLTQGAFAVCTLMNGENTLDDIREIFAQQFRQELPAVQLVEILNQLDQAGLLDSPLFQVRYEQLVEEYRQAPVRPCRDAPEDGELGQVRAELVAMIGQGQASSDGARVVGLIAPHLDYERGRPCYAETYAQLRGQNDIDRFVILGTNHFGRSPSAVWTAKDYETPLGVVETDRAFIEQLQRRCGANLGKDELDHLNEHSVELQATILQAIHGKGPVKIVPILCPDVCGPAGLDSADGNGVGLARFAEALAEAVREAPGRTCVIAGADFSHIGRQFGDDRDLDEAFLKEVEAADKAVLARIEAGDPAGMIEELLRTDNVYRVCSAGSLYALLRVLAGATVRVLRYHQAVNTDEDTGVTCASAVLTTDG